QLADPRAAAAMLRELVRRAEHLGHALDEREALAFEQFLRARLQVQLCQLRLPIEHVERGRRAGHVEVNDGLRFRGEMRFPRRERIGGFERGRNAGVAVARKQTAEGNGAEAQAGLTEKLSAREGARLCKTERIIHASQMLLNISANKRVFSLDPLKR